MSDPNAPREQTLGSASEGFQASHTFLKPKAPFGLEMSQNEYRGSDTTLGRIPESLSAPTNHDSDLALSRSDPIETEHSGFVKNK
ncbi:hypothetical protein VNO77_44737 [Canavalia gladiata]|uniref:Uncharacterized protein n=1 Tax=Canavalia gladiata TaxID=3824 RepID=A0AAN9JWJ1_CANGL